MILTTAKRRGADARSIVGGPDRTWYALTDEKGVPFTFTNISGGQLITARGNRVFAIDTRNRTYRVLYTHPSMVFSPSLIGDELLFSDSASFVPGRATPHMRRRLFRYKLGTKELKRVLQPWESYQIGKVMGANDGMWCLNMSFPAVEPDKAPRNARTHALGDPEAYCFEKATMFREDVPEASIWNAALPGPAASFHSLSIDQARLYAAGWHIGSGGPATWRIFDFKSKKVLWSMGTHTDQVTVAPAGDRFAFATPAFGRDVRGSIHDIRTGAVLKRFKIDSWDVETVALRPRE